MFRDPESRCPKCGYGRYFREEDHRDPGNMPIALKCWSCLKILAYEWPGSGEVEKTLGILPRGHKVRSGEAVIAQAKDTADSPIVIRSDDEPGAKTKMQQELEAWMQRTAEQNGDAAAEVCPREYTVRLRHDPNWPCGMWYAYIDGLAEWRERGAGLRDLVRQVAMAIERVEQGKHPTTRRGHAVAGEERLTLCVSGTLSRWSAVASLPDGTPLFDVKAETIRLVLAGVADEMLRREPEEGNKPPTIATPEKPEEPVERSNNGRPPAFTEQEKMEIVRESVDERKTNAELAAAYGVHRNTISAVVREKRAESQKSEARNGRPSNRRGSLSHRRIEFQGGVLEVALTVDLFATGPEENEAIQMIAEAVQAFAAMVEEPVEREPV